MICCPLAANAKPIPYLKTSFMTRWSITQKWVMCKLVSLCALCWIHGFKWTRQDCCNGCCHTMVLWWINITNYIDILRQLKLFAQACELLKYSRHDIVSQMNKVWNIWIYKILVSNLRACEARAAIVVAYTMANPLHAKNAKSATPCV